MSTKSLFILLAALMLLAAVLFVFVPQTQSHAVTNFEECKKAGYPIMESYPEQCHTSDGKSFVNEAQEHLVPPTETGPGIQRNGCIVGGCSGEVCSEASEGPAMSNCIYKAEFACYKTAKCDRQADGKCGWTLSADTVACLETASDTKVESMPQ